MQVSSCFPESSQVVLNSTTLFSCNILLFCLVYSIATIPSPHSYIIKFTDEQYKKLKFYWFMFERIAQKNLAAQLLCTCLQSYTISPRLLPSLFLLSPFYGFSTSPSHDFSLIILFFLYFFLLHLLHLINHFSLDHTLILFLCTSIDKVNVQVATS